MSGDQVAAVSTLSPSLEEPLLPRDPATGGGDDAAATSNGDEGGIDRRRRRRRGCWGRRSEDDAGGVEKSRNINIVLAYTLLSFAGRSLWSQSALSAFVYLLRDSNPEYVGYLTAIMGIAQLIASFPSGYLADKHRRDALIHAASAVGLVAAGVTTASVLLESYAMLGAALAVWGAFWGMANTSISALFADSILDGDRSRYFTHRMILVKCGNLMGPLTALLMFALQGDSWTTRDCAFVMGAGQIVCLPAMALLCFLSDDHAVVKDDQELDAGVGAGDRVATERSGELREPLLSSTRAEDDEGLEREKEDIQPVDIDTEESTPQHSSDEEDIEAGVGVDSVGDDAMESLDDGNGDEEMRHCFCIPESRMIPVLIASADLTGGIAAGMSVRYFPIFFLDNIHLDPVRVQIVYALALVFQIFISRVALKGGERFGRCQMAAALKWTGVLCFILLILSYKSGLPSIIILVLFVGRMGFMNSTGALTKSVLMDAVPRSERGKWSALESVNMFSWAGSAAIGGWLVQVEGIVFNFCVTAALQVAATVPLVVLFGKVKDEADMRREGEARRRRSEMGAETEGSSPRAEGQGGEMGRIEGDERRPVE